MMAREEPLPVTKWRWSPQPAPEPDKRTHAPHKIIKKASEIEIIESLEIFVHEALWQKTCFGSIYIPIFDDLDVF